MATAPCHFVRPKGTELIRKTKILFGQDQEACEASNKMKSSKTHPGIHLDFILDEEAGDTLQARRVQIEGNHVSRYCAKLEIVSIHQFASNRAHLLCRTPTGETVVIENYSFTHKQGDYLEFAKLWGDGAGFTYLIDPNRDFPLDSLNTGLEIQAKLTEPVLVQNLTRILREHGYKLATTEKKLEYKWFCGSHCICLNSEGELVGAELAGSSAYRITAEELPVLPEHYLLLEKLPVVNGQVAA